MDIRASAISGRDLWCFAKSSPVMNTLLVPGYVLRRPRMRETSLGAREGEDESVRWVWVAAGGTQEVMSLKTVFLP